MDGPSRPVSEREHRTEQQPRTGAKGAAILYRPGDAAYADVVSKYFPGLQMVEVKGLEESVAILVTTGYHPATPGQGDASGAASECPNPTA